MGLRLALPRVLLIFWIRVSPTSIRALYPAATEEDTVLRSEAASVPFFSSHSVIFCSSCLYLVSVLCMMSSHFQRHGSQGRPLSSGCGWRRQQGQVSGGGGRGGREVLSTFDKHNRVFGGALGWWCSCRRTSLSTAESVHSLRWPEGRDQWS